MRRVGGRPPAWALAIATVATVVAAGCYRPNVLDGGFLCADPPRKACPDGFACGGDGRCHLSSAVDADAGMCSSDFVTPLCAEAPTAGQACSPACQNGCACGRCNVVGEQAACVPAGTKTLGQKCNPKADDCAAGFICLGEMCGNLLGRCYRHCTKDAQCAGTMCQIPILDDVTETGFFACGLAASDCNPVNDTGCPDPALSCYYLASSNQTVCDCPTQLGMLNQPCSIYTECAPGLACVNVTGSSRCYRVCDSTTPNCNGAPCVTSTTGAKYGYCQTAN